MVNSTFVWLGNLFDIPDYINLILMSCLSVKINTMSGKINTIRGRSQLSTFMY